MTPTRQTQDSVRLVAGVLLAYSLVVGVMGTMVGLFAGPHILVPGLVSLAFALMFGGLAKGGIGVRGWRGFFQVIGVMLFGILHVAQFVMLVSAGGWEEKFLAILPASIAGLSFWLGWTLRRPGRFLRDTLS